MKLQMTYIFWGGFMQIIMVYLGTDFIILFQTCRFYSEIIALFYIFSYFLFLRSMIILFMQPLLTLWVSILICMFVPKQS